MNSEKEGPEILSAKISTGGFLHFTSLTAREKGGKNGYYGEDWFWAEALLGLNHRSNQIRHQMRSPLSEKYVQSRKQITIGDVESRWN
jgi:hypothetical protein